MDENNTKLFDKLLLSTYGVDFTAAYLLKVTWDKMAPPYPYPKLSEVCNVFLIMYFYKLYNYLMAINMIVLLCKYHMIFLLDNI